MCRTPTVALLLCLSPLALFAQGNDGQARPGWARFAPAERCALCHTDLADSTGADISIVRDWRATMMANSARDPYWQAAVRAEVLDHPEFRTAIEDKCSTCHMPMARNTAAADGRPGEVFANFNAATGGGDPLAMDGVSCSLCHQISAEGLGDDRSFSGGFVIEAPPLGKPHTAFGPFAIEASRADAMWAGSGGFVPERGTHLRESVFCGSCHTLYTHYVDASGEIAGELPEQVPYLEWLHSDYADSLSCADCHMPVVEGPAPIASILADPRAPVSRHVFRGANGFMLGVLREQGAASGVAASRAELDAAIADTRQELSTRTATVVFERVERSGSVVRADVRIRNLAGHKFPTAYPSRRAWLHFTLRDATGWVIFESGAPEPRGSVRGNDNDTDGSRFEPHYAEIVRPDQVQIYESIMVDTEGRVTTGLLRGSRYIKDNRLLPAGFDRATADNDVAVRGAASDDPDFSGAGDRIRYTVRVDDAVEPVMATIELLYQTIGYRWAHNLARHEAPEITRFLDAHGAGAGRSAVRVAQDSTTVER